MLSIDCNCTVPHSHLDKARHGPLGMVIIGTMVMFDLNSYLRMIYETSKCKQDEISRAVEISFRKWKDEDALRKNYMPKCEVKRNVNRCYSVRLESGTGI